jgi:hypothetical protein
MLGGGHAAHIFKRVALAGNDTPDQNLARIKPIEVAVVGPEVVCPGQEKLSVITEG